MRKINEIVYTEAQKSILKSKRGNGQNINQVLTSGHIQEQSTSNIADESTAKDADKILKETLDSLQKPEKTMKEIIAGSMKERQVNPNRKNSTKTAQRSSGRKVAKRKTTRKKQVKKVGKEKNSKLSVYLVIVLAFVLIYYLYLGKEI